MSDLVAAAQGGKEVARKTMRDVVEGYADEYERALAGRTDVQHFVRSALSVISSTPKLQVVTERSMVAAVLLAAQLNLEIGGGLNQFHLTPRSVKERVRGEGGKWEDRWSDVCVPIIGYQGFVDLAYRNQRTLDFNKIRVYEADDFEEGYESERGYFFHWRPAPGSAARGDRGKLRGVLVATRTAGGGRIETWLDVPAIEARRPASSKEQTKDGRTYLPNTPWKTDYAAMCDKTVVREHAKLLPKSVEVQRAIALDERVLVASGGDVAAVDDDEDAEVAA